MSADRVIQAALATALRADSSFMGLVGGRLYDDEAPDGTPFPYTVFGSLTETLDRTHDLDGYSHTFEFHDWSDRDGKLECQRIREARNAVLHNARLTVTGWGLVKIAYEFGEVLPARDELLNRTLRHGVSRYRVLSLEAP